MKIEALYNDMHYEEFDPTVLVAADPWKNSGTNVLTDVNLYLNDIDHNGVILALHWYNAKVTAQTAYASLDGQDVPAAERRLGCAILLVAPEDLSDLIWLKKDGEKILWRQGGNLLGADMSNESSTAPIENDNVLINGEKFFVMEQLCYSDNTTKSVNERAVAVFDNLVAAYPNVDEEVLASSMGYTLPAINYIRQGVNAARNATAADADYDE